MNLFCTKKLLDLGRYSVEIGDNYNPLFSWYGNVIKVNRKNFVVFINEKTGFPIFFYGVKKKDLDNIYQHIQIAIEFALKREDISLEHIFYYLEKDSNQTIHKTNSRQLIGSLNEVIFDVQCIDVWELIEGYLQVTSLSHEMSDMLLKINGKYVVPIDEMRKELEMLYKQTKNS